MGCGSSQQVQVTKIPPGTTTDPIYQYRTATKPSAAVKAKAVLNTGMGCASSTGAHVQVTTTRTTGGVMTTQYTTTTAYQHHQQAVKPVVVKNLPDAPKASNSRKSSSSSSSSDDDSVDLDKQRKQLKEASARAAAVKVQEETEVDGPVATPKVQVKLSVEIYHRYNALTTVIRPLERKNIVQQLEEKMRLSIELKNQAVRMNEEYKQLTIKTQKEYQDVQNIQNMQKFFQSQVHFDTQMSKEQEEYIQAKTEMEDCYKKLVVLQTRQSKLESEMKSLQEDHQELMKHYKEQDEILDSIFGGSYGSELEDKLEAELDQQQDKRQRIEITAHRWRNTQIMVQSAYDQLNYAYDRWQNILRIPINKTTQYLRIQATAEVRSYLIAASQNLTNAHRTLNTVKFPYCDKNEVQTLNKAITYIFIDSMNLSRHSHAGTVYRSTRDRCFVLSQWVTQVVTTTVQKDLIESRTECTSLQTKLRAERSKLMKEKIEEETGVKIEVDDSAQDSGVDTDDEPDASDVAAEAEKVPETDDLDKQIKEAQEGDGTEEAPAAEDEKPAAVPLDELAPAPNTKELFGNLETVMAEYDKQKEEYAREMEANRARQQADFQMKLQARRSRKRRMMAQQQELNELMKKEQETAAVEVPAEA